MTNPRHPILAALIANTPGSQSRAHALASIKARRVRLLGSTAFSEDFAAAESMPRNEDVEAFAAGFFERLMEKTTPQRGAKPKLVVDNSDGDDEPPPGASR